MNLRYLVICAVMVLLHAPAYALKLMSPEAVCKQRGLTENSTAWQSCIAEVTAENERVTQNFYANINEQQQATVGEPVIPKEEEKSVYGIDTPLVPAFMQKNFSKRIQGHLYTNPQVQTQP